jgi:hypothetical protein
MMDRYETGYERHTMDLDPQGDWVDYDIAQARIAELEAALTWYAAHVPDCRKAGLEGDVARGKLDRDGDIRNELFELRADIYKLQDSDAALVRVNKMIAGLV